jgi:prophage antirepressor-like protein
MARQAHYDFMTRIAIYLDKENDAVWKANLHSPKSFLNLVMRVMRRRLLLQGDTASTRSQIRAEIRRIEFLTQRYKQNKPEDSVYAEIHLAAQRLFPVNPQSLDYRVAYDDTNQPRLKFRKKQ